MEEGRGGQGFMAVVVGLDVVFLLLFLLLLWVSLRLKFGFTTAHDDITLYVMLLRRRSRRSRRSGQSGLVGFSQQCIRLDPKKKTLSFLLLLFISFFFVL